MALATNGHYIARHEILDLRALARRSPQEVCLYALRVCGDDHKRAITMLNEASCVVPGDSDEWTVASMVAALKGGTQ